MKQPATRILYNYWNDVRGGRIAPTRFEIEPSRIATVLSETFILARAGADAFPFRLAGTRICDQLGRELRGQDFLALVANDDRRLIAKAMQAVTMHGAALELDFAGETADGRAAAFEAIVLPLIHPVSEVTRYLGVMTAIDPPAWLGAEPVAETWLIRHRIIWPEGRRSSCADDERQLPFVPELAAARIFRGARRQFRILDGGRKE